MPELPSYRPQDQLALWMLTSPERPVLVGEISLASNGQAVALRYVMQRPEVEPLKAAERRLLAELVELVAARGVHGLAPAVRPEWEDAGDDDRLRLAVDHVALSNLPEEDHNDVVELASAYREHFGFPLVICARETEHFDRVIKNGWSRMDNSTPAEKAFALIEIAKIANYRFDDLVADANPIAAARFTRLNELQ